jgi:hypothetical protein
MKAIEGLTFLIQFGTFGTWITAALISAIVGARKGMGFVGFLLGFVLGPFGMALVLAMAGSRMECPFCVELVRTKATKCPHCHSWLIKNPPVAVAAPTPPTEQPAPATPRS